MSDAEQRAQSLEPGGASALSPETIAPRPRRETYPMTMAIIAVNVVLFLAVEATGGTGTENLLRWGADFGPRTLGGEWWRMLASTFLHGGVLHIAFNMLALWSLGPLMEKLTGRLPFLLMYLACGLGGSLLSLWWHPMIVSIGASGAIFGVAGALLAVLYLKHVPIPKVYLKKNLGSIGAFVVYNLAFGAIVPGIDNSAHLGGLLTGLLVGALLVPVYERNASPLRRYIAFPLIALLLLGGATMAQRGRNGALELGTGMDLVQQQQYEAALPHLEKAVKAQPDDFDAQFQLGFAYSQLNRFQEAMGPMSEAVRLQPDSYEAQFDLGLIYLNLKRVADALPHFQAAAGMHPDGETWYYVGMASLQAGRNEDALVAMKKSLAADPHGKNADLARQTVELLEQGEAGRKPASK